MEEIKRSGEDAGLTKPCVSTFELRPAHMGRIDCLDYFVDGVSLFTRFPMDQLIQAFSSCLPENIPEELRKPDSKMAHGITMFTASRLGCGNSKWRRLALQTLLLKCEPDLPGGGRIIYGCPMCFCTSIYCTIENSAGLINWRDFSAKIQAFPDSHSSIDVPDLYFEQSPYFASLEPLLAEVA